MTKTKYKTLNSNFRQNIKKSILEGLPFIFRLSGSAAILCLPSISYGRSPHEFLLQMEVFQPGTRSKGRPDSTGPPSHREFFPQSSPEASSPVFHTEWISWTSKEKWIKFIFNPSVMYSNTEAKQVSCKCKLEHYSSPNIEGAVYRKAYAYLEEGVWTDQPKSAIFSSPLAPSSRFSGLMSLWITFLEWQ